MIQAIYTGVAGLKAHQTQMDVIGNNIANINTVGFKEERAEFKDALSQTLSAGTAGNGSVGGTNPSQVGLGVTVGSISSNQAQGSLQFTGRPLDVAIEGNGFLTMSDGKGQFYTRDGSMSVDSDGELTSSGNTGMKVMGWNVDPATGKVDTAGALSPVKLPIGQLSVARATGNVSYGGNLDSTTPTDGTASATYNVYDSGGQAHSVNVTFTKTENPGEWSWKATTPNGDTVADSGSGTVLFSADGKMQSGGDAAATLPGSDAAAGQALKLDFNSISSLASTGQSTISPTAQDGLPAGTLTGYAIEADGTVNGTFSNGMTQPVAQIGLSSFANPGGLLKAGDNMLTATANAGVPQVGSPTTGGRGKLSSGSLEMSNVDLSTEFTNMIVSQRGFQANSKIITTADEMLQEMVALKR